MMSDSSNTAAANRSALSFAMGLSLVLGLLMFVIKGGAYVLTGSAAILSDAAESVVHVAAVMFAAYSLWLSFKPADDSHPYGHAKIAFFSAGFEGAMIILAAIYILYISLEKWIMGAALENLGFGTLLTAAASLINGTLGIFLLRTGRKRNSLILVANGKHVLTDCWTSLAVLVGLALVMITGWTGFDPLCGILMAANILLSGVALIHTACAGLMDAADPKAHAQLIALLERETRQQGVAYHNLLHRSVGDLHWIEVHLLFGSNVGLAEAHRTATAIEETIEAALGPNTRMTTHLETREDHALVHQHPHNGEV